MHSVKKELVAAAIATASISAGHVASGANVQSQGQECHPDSGYIVSMQDKKTDRVMGVYYIKDMEALSLSKKGNVSTDQGHTIDSDSMQLNTYLRGTLRDGKKRFYWFQDTVTFVYSKTGLEQYLSSQAYELNPSDTKELIISGIKGKGSIFSTDSCSSPTSSKGKTYAYTMDNVPASIPQYGYLSMSEHLMDGKIYVEVKYWNGSMKKVDTYDTIMIRNKDKFAKAHFVSNDILDTEMGFGGYGCSSTAYFIRMKAYAGMYFYGKDGYTDIRYMKGNSSTAEGSANLECRYESGMEEFYKDRSLDREMLKKVARIYDRKVLHETEHAK